MLLKSKINEIKSILKSDSVLTNIEERYCYSVDASNVKNAGNISDLVVFVETIEEVQQILKFANKYEIPVIARGAGTNMVGACLCNNGGIVLNFSKMNKIIDIDINNSTVTVQPGVILGELKSKVEELGFFYPPDPSNYKVSTIGGSIAQSSGGAKAFKYGTTKDYVLSLKIVNSEGELIKLGSGTIKDSVGYHLAQLMVGSEGTLGIVVEATLKIIPKPETTQLIIAYYSTIKQAIDATNLILKSQIFPASIDFMDKNSMITVEDFMNCGLKTNFECVVLYEIDGSKTSVEEDTKKIEKLLINNGAEFVQVPDKPTEELIWTARRSSYSATTRLAPDVISDDIIVPRNNLFEMITFCNITALKYGLKMCLVGHIGDGNIHPQIALNLNNDNEFKNYMSFKSEIYAKVKELNGSISAEHGVGLEKLPYLENTIDKNAINYMKLIKKSFDPKNILNPGKIFN